jgi:hypothetical protein
VAIHTIALLGKAKHTGATGALARHTITYAIVNSIYVRHISSPPLPIINRILWAVRQTDV